jgi:CheY-like chemotaxis protein
MNSKILIVEDEYIVAADLEAKLTKLGCQVVGTAASGEEAVSLAEVHRPQIVLMDIQLQGTMSGIEAGRLIQEKTGAAIIFVTAYAAVFLREPGMMRPPGICLSKPFSSLQLKAALQSIEQSVH